MDFDDIPAAIDEQVVVLEPDFEDAPPVPPQVPVEDSFLPDPDPIEEDALTYVKICLSYGVY